MRGEEFLQAALRRKQSVQVEVEHRYLLKFSLDEEWYGVNIVDTVEVIKCPDVFNIPYTPDYIMGVANLRGEILAIIDIRKLLGTPVSTTSAEKHIIVVERKDMKVGIMVDRAVDVVSVPSSDVKPALSKADGARRLITGEVQLNGDVLAILDLSVLIDEEDR